MMDNSFDTPSINRRDFLKKAAIGTSAVAAIPTILGASSKSQTTDSDGGNAKINVAIVGVAGKGLGPTVDCLKENVVALCDVDMGNVNRTRNGSEDHHRMFDDALKKHEANGAKWFKDYRVMLETMHKEIDAIIISIPDFMHYPVAMSAINFGIHVYCEKPLTHTVEEARLLAAAAKKKGVVTQMGNQGHSLGGTRLVREWVQAGVIGEVKEVHSWTDRPAIFWEQGLEKPDHSKAIPVVPEGLDWDLWQGISGHRAYDPAYTPFSWRAYLDYGCGALGDMACHIMDAAFWALDLGSPTNIEASSTNLTGYTYPKSSVVTFEFPKRNEMSALTYKWYDGDLRPSLPKFLKGANPLVNEYHSNGTLIIGDNAAILTGTYARRARIVPDETFKALRPNLPPRTLRRIKGSHLNEWFSAIRENRQASSDFSYAAPFTETILLGTIAQQTNRRLEFDGTKGQFIDDAEANKLISKKYPKGWIL